MTPVVACSQQLAQTGLCVSLTRGTIGLVVGRPWSGLGKLSLLVGLCILIEALAFRRLAKLRIEDVVLRVPSLRKLMLNVIGAVPLGAGAAMSVVYLLVYAAGVYPEGYGRGLRVCIGVPFLLAATYLSGSILAVITLDSVLYRHYRSGCAIHDPAIVERLRERLSRWRMLHRLLFRLRGVSFDRVLEQVLGAL